MKFTVSAPGKIILFGEHSVVYGNSAIAAAIDRRTTVTITELTEDKYCNKFYTELTEYNDFTIEIPLDIITQKQQQAIPTASGDSLQFTTPEVINHDKYLDIIKTDITEIIDNNSLNPAQVSLFSAVFYVIRGMFYAAKRIIGSIKLTISSDLNVGSGTGSSASLAVCLVAVFFCYIRKINSKQLQPDDPDAYYQYKFDEQDLFLINKWAYSVERIFHGTPSGLDNHVATYGSIVNLSFKKETKEKLIVNLDGGGGLFRVLLIYSGVPRSTMKMVKNVRNLYNENTEAVTNIFNAMDIIASDAIATIKEIVSLKSDNVDYVDKFAHLEDLIDINQGLLVSLKVSHQTINEIVDVAAKYKLHAKLTGAGGGGYVFALVPPSVTEETVNDCMKALSEKGYSASEVKLSGPGLTVHY